MKTPMQRILEVVNMRSDCSVKTKFNKEEIEFWIEEERKHYNEKTLNENK